MQEAMQSTSYGCKRAEDVRLFQGQPHSAEARLLQRGWGATQRHLETLEVDVEVDFKEADCSKKQYVVLHPEPCAHVLMAICSGHSHSARQGR